MLFSDAISQVANGIADYRPLDSAQFHAPLPELSVAAAAVFMHN